MHIILANVVVALGRGGDGGDSGCGGGGGGESGGSGGVAMTYYTDEPKGLRRISTIRSRENPSFLFLKFR